MNIDKQKKWAKRHYIITAEVIIIIVFFLTLSLLESILNFRSPDWNKDIPFTNEVIKIVGYSPLIDTYIYPEEIYYQFSNAKTLVQNNYRFRTDSSGFIMPTKIYQNPDIILAFLGGSTTECAFVQEQNRFPALSASLLEKKIGKKINSLNLAVSGVDSRDGINNLLNILIPKKPDFVLFMYNMNDLSRLAYNGTYWNNPNRETIKIIDKVSYKTILPYLIKNNFPRVYRSLKYRITHSSFKIKMEPQNIVRRIDTDTILDSYKRNLITFIKICDTWDIKPVLMTQANRYTSERPKSLMFNPYQYDYREIFETYNKMNEIIRETAKENNVILVDLEKTIPKDTSHIYDLLHLNDKGSILASQTIATVLSNYMSD